MKRAAVFICGTLHLSDQKSLSLTNSPSPVLRAVLSEGGFSQRHPGPFFALSPAPDEPEGQHTARQKPRRDPPAGQGPGIPPPEPILRESLRDGGFDDP